MSELRPYQADAIEGIRRALARHRSTLLVMATGTGKTRVFGEVSRLWTTARPLDRVLVLAHRKELIQQASTRIPVVGVGVEQGARRSSPRDRVVVGSVASMVRRLDRFDPGAFDLVIIDEAHLAAAKSYQRILDHFPAAKVLGVTATPDRLDGRPLGDTFESVAYEYPIDRAIREGYLAPVRAKRVEVRGLELDGVRVTRGKGDFSERQLSEAMRQNSPLHGIVRPLLDLAGDRPTVAFCVDIAHGQAVAEVMNQYRPGCMAAIWGADPDRDAKRELFEAGAIQFVANCDLWSVGVDIPMIACVAMCAPTHSRAKYTQRVGRGTRLHPGKLDLLILDFVGATDHRLIGPADVLAGEQVADDIRAKVAQLREEWIDLGELDLLEMAREFVAQEREFAKAAARVRAVVDFLAVEIDPFLGTRLASGQQSLDLGDPMSARQRKRLKDLGCEKPPPAEMSASQAEELIQALAERRERGLCTLRAARRLANRVPNVETLKHDQAQEIFAYFRRTSWNRAIPRKFYT